MPRGRNTIKDVCCRDFQNELQMQLQLLDDTFKAKIRAINNMYEAYLRNIPPEFGNSIPFQDAPDIDDVDESAVQEEQNVVEESVIREEQSDVEELSIDNSGKTEDVNEISVPARLLISEGSSRTNSTKPMRINSSFVSNLSGLSSVPENASISESLQVSTTKRMDAHKFKTPAVRPFVGQPAVTPKVCMNTPLSFLRRPKEGEMALSMAGSPLLVSSTSSDIMANVNIPLMDGRVVSILPKPNLQPYELPHLDPCTRAQLTTLQEHLATVLQLSKDADIAKSIRH